jgi:hypothetical protein
MLGIDANPYAIIAVVDRFDITICSNHTPLHAFSFTTNQTKRQCHSIRKAVTARLRTGYSIRK